MEKELFTARLVRDFLKMFSSSTTEPGSDLEQNVKYCKDFEPNPHLPGPSLNVEWKYFHADMRKTAAKCQ